MPAAILREKQIKKYRLSDGDRISLGVHELVYRDLRKAHAELHELVEDQLDDAEADDQGSAVNEQ